MNQKTEDHLRKSSSAKQLAWLSTKAILWLKPAMQWEFARLQCAAGSCSSKVNRAMIPKAQSMTPEQRSIQELEKQVQRLEREKSILKKATALLISDEI